MVQCKSFKTSKINLDCDLQECKYYTDINLMHDENKLVESIQV